MSAAGWFRRWSPDNSQREGGRGESRRAQRRRRRRRWRPNACALPRLRSEALRDDEEEEGRWDGEQEQERGPPLSNEEEEGRRGGEQEQERWRPLSNEEEEEEEGDKAENKNKKVGGDFEEGERRWYLKEESIVAVVVGTTVSNGNDGTKRRRLSCYPWECPRWSLSPSPRTTFSFANIFLLTLLPFSRKSPLSSHWHEKTILIGKISGTRDGPRWRDQTANSGRQK